ncbi:MAG TPA: hypothetical protein ENI87_14615 [bacterium]|nr:hypothetical protein [bacterium]
MQGGGGVLTGPATAPEGGTITVKVGANVDKIIVSTGGPSKYIPVPESGEVTFPVPAEATGGTVVEVSVGEGLKRKTILIEIVGTSA